MEAPAYLFMGQIAIESRCDAGVTAFDGGMGLGQFMPDTAKWIQEQEPALRELALQPLPYDPAWSIRALILYDKWLRDRVLCRDWHYAYRAYNGGLTRLNREIENAGTCDEQTVASFCRRKVIKLKRGALDLCRVNCEYPDKIDRAADKFRRFP